MSIDWEPRLAALVATLVDQGQLRSEEWTKAFAATPRHLFTPEIVLTTPEGYRSLSGDSSASHQEWLSAVYSDESLVIQDKPHAGGHTLPSGEPLRVPTSSSTMPSLMARMLEALDVDDGMRVLDSPGSPTMTAGTAGPSRWSDATPSATTESDAVMLRVCGAQTIPGGCARCRARTCSVPCCCGRGNPSTPTTSAAGAGHPSGARRSRIAHQRYLR